VITLALGDRVFRFPTYILGGSDVEARQVEVLVDGQWKPHADRVVFEGAAGLVHETEPKPRQKRPAVHKGTPGIVKCTLVAVLLAATFSPTPASSLVLFGVYVLARKGYHGGQR